MDIVAKEAVAIDRGALKYAWFDGLVEATCSDPVTVREALAVLKPLAPGAFSVSFEGTLCSFLAEPKVFAGSDLAPWSSELFMQGLSRLMAALDADSIESTLRRTEVYAEGTREIIYSLGRGAVRELSRDRAVSSADLERAPRLAQLPASRGTIIRVSVIGAFLIIAAVLTAWQQGIVDRLFATSEHGIARSTGQFQDLLQYDLKQSLGNYEIEVRRGPRYPTTSAEVDRLLEGVEKTADRACVTVVAEGGTIYARLEDDQHRLLSAQPIDLRPLLSDEKNTATCRIPGRINAASVTLSLDKGEPQP